MRKQDMILYCEYKEIILIYYLKKRKFHSDFAIILFNSTLFFQGLF